MFLLGGSTYRVSSIIGTRVNVTSATGYRPTIPSWTGEANSRSIELSRRFWNFSRRFRGPEGRG